MFDPYGISTDSDAVAGDNSSSRNNQQTPVLSTLSSSPNNISRKRKIVASDNFTNGGQQQQQTQASSMQELASFPSPATMLLNNNSNVSQGTLLDGGGLDNLFSMFHSSSSLSRGQDLNSTFRGGTAAFPGSTQSIPLLSDTSGVGSYSPFGQGLSNGSIPSSIAAMSDPLQRLLRNYQSPDGGVLNESSTFNGVRSHSNINGIQSTSNIDIGNVNQLSTLFQQQQQQGSKTTLPSVPMIPNEFFPHTAPFQLGNSSLASNFNPDRHLFQNFQSDSNELIRKNQLRQQQLAVVSDLNTTMPSHLMNLSVDAHLSMRSMNSSIPFEIRSNSIPMSQLLMSNELIRSSGNGEHITPITNKSDNSSVYDLTANKIDSSNLSASILYKCDVGRSKPLFLPWDSQTLSEYQCLLRKQIELFEATEQDIHSSTKGRNKPIFLGQVGVRCVHCRSIKPEHRSRGATYYPATLGAMYQSGQTMAIRHLRHHCARIPIYVRDRLFMLKDGKSSAGGGKKYWSDAASVMGVFISDEGFLRFKSPPTTKAAALSDENKSTSIQKSSQG